MASPEEEKEPTIGWFSSSAAEQFGTVVWEDEAGREVVCTQVGRPGETCSHAGAAIVSTTLRRCIRGYPRERLGRFFLFDEPASVSRRFGPWNRGDSDA